MMLWGQVLVTWRLSWGRAPSDKCDHNTIMVSVCMQPYWQWPKYIAEGKDAHFSILKQFFPPAPLHVRRTPWRRGRWDPSFVISFFKRFVKFEEILSQGWLAGPGGMSCLGQRRPSWHLLPHHTAPSCSHQVTLVTVNIDRHHQHECHWDFPSVLLVALLMLFHHGQVSTDPLCSRIRRSNLTKRPKRK